MRFLSDTRLTRVSGLAMRSLGLSGLPAVLRMIRPPDLSILSFRGVDRRRGMGCGAGSRVGIDRFHGICRSLARKYHVMALTEALEMIERGERIPPRSVVLTFDGGYASNFRLAFPILKRQGLPATIFLATQFVDKGVWLWPDRVEHAIHATRQSHLHLSLGGREREFALDSTESRADAVASLCGLLRMNPQSSLDTIVAGIENALGASLDDSRAEAPDIYRPLDWSQVRTMADSGLVSIGAHTHRQVILSRCTTGLIDDELRKCRDAIREHTGLTPKLFAYPGGRAGDFNDSTRADLQRWGFRCALTKLPGFNGTGSDPFTLRRFEGARDPVHVDAMTSGALHLLARMRSCFLHQPSSRAASPGTA